MMVIAKAEVSERREEHELKVSISTENYNHKRIK
jgi:hypothetical protein